MDCGVCFFCWWDDGVFRMMLSGIMLIILSWGCFWGGLGRVYLWEVGFYYRGIVWEVGGKMLRVDRVENCYGRVCDDVVVYRNWRGCDFIIVGYIG